MTPSSQKLTQECLRWLKENVFTKWTEIGVHQRTKLFVENLTLDNKPFMGAHRCLVQARQIYSFAEAYRMGLMDLPLAKKIVKEGTDAYIRFYAQPDGSFVHAVELDGRTVNEDRDLYSQAFAIFGLANGFQVTQDSNYKKAALNVLQYLRTHRANSEGGFTEIKGGKLMYQSNPHMHLFESAIAWSAVDPDPIWKNLAKEIFDLCRTKFIQQSGILAEHFDSQWKPQLENGQYLFEPGHHYEWCWLFHQYKEYCDPNADIHFSHGLFAIAEKWGLSLDGSLVFDEIWNDGKTKKKSSRFWPQSERVKAAISMKRGDVADVALNTLVTKYLLIDQGFWEDTLFEDGTYLQQSVKASSLYHILNAISEYVKFRNKI